MLSDAYTTVAATALGKLLWLTFMRKASLLRVACLTGM